MPFSGLDVNNVEKVTKLVTSLTSDNEYLTVLMVTHDIGAALSVADHLWVMGRERDETGKPIEGARIIIEYNLIDMGLAWHPELRMSAEFRQAVALVTEQFRTLC